MLWGRCDTKYGTRVETSKELTLTHRGGLGVGMVRKGGDGGSGT